MVVRVRTDGEAPRPARRVGDRRQAIIDTATLLFAERGFGAVSVQEIADSAEIHKTTVLYHFPSKEALQEAVLDGAFGRLSDVLREFLAGAASRERIAYMLDQIHAFFAEHLALTRLLQRELLEPSGDELRRFVEAIYMPGIASIERAVAEGIVRPVDPAMFIHDLHVELIGYFCHAPLMERLRDGDPLGMEALIARRNHLLDQISRQLGLEEDAP